MSAIRPNTDQFAALASAAKSDDGPVVMVNLLKFKSGGGAGEYGRYGDEATRMIGETGGRIIYSGRCEQVLIGDASETWDAVVLVDVGANVMQVSVVRNEQSVYTREQAFGGNQLTADLTSRYGMSVEEAENAKRAGGLPDDFESEVLRPFMENLSMEVQRALQFFFTSTSYSQVDHILLAGGSSVIPGLDEVVQSRTQVPTVVSNPFAAMQTSPRIQLKRLMQDAPSLIVACGLAMRRFDPV